MTSLNPFIYSRSLQPTEFTGRRSELNKIMGRLVTGQSVAVIGQPNIGKTSLLKFIHEDHIRQEGYGNQFDNYSYSYLDVLAIQGIQSQKDFWQYAIRPLKNSGLENLCYQAEQDGFTNLALETLFDAIHKLDRRLVLLLDEFDSLLSHRALNSPDFYGGFRSLVSRSGGLVAVIATRKPLHILNQLTQEINPHGSPYFNVFVEIQLGTLKNDAFDALLKRGGEILTPTDKNYVLRVSGRHPYLAQTASAMLWDAHDEGLQGADLYRDASRNLYRQSRQHFEDTWHFWTNATRKTITAIALAQIPRLLENHQFKVSELLEDFDDFDPELDVLQTSGTLTKSDDNEWIIAQDALLWWLTDELRRNVRDDTAFGDWIRAQEMDNLLTRSDKEKLAGAANRITTLLGKGSATLIETLAKGFGKAILP